MTAPALNNDLFTADITAILREDYGRYSHNDRAYHTALIEDFMESIKIRLAVPTISKENANRLMNLLDRLQDLQEAQTDELVPIGSTEITPAWRLYKKFQSSLESKIPL